MKIRPEHYQHMRDAIMAIADHVPAMKTEIATDPRVKDPEVRLWWDLSYRAGLTAWICENIYSYANDKHLDTALRKILDEVYEALTLNRVSAAEMEHGQEIGKPEPVVAEGLASLLGMSAPPENHPCISKDQWDGMSGDLRERIWTETRIAGQCIQDLLDAGFLIDVDDGEDLAVRRGGSLDEILPAMMAVDEERLVARHPDGRRGSVLLVYGNDCRFQL